MPKNKADQKTQCRHSDDFLVLVEGVMTCGGCAGPGDKHVWVPTARPFVIHQPKPKEKSGESRSIDDAVMVARMLDARATRADCDGRTEDATAFRIAMQEVYTLINRLAPKPIPKQTPQKKPNTVRRVLKALRLA